MSKYKVIIFDMDGVLVDTENYYYTRRKTFLTRKGISIDHLSPLVFIGGNMKQVWHMILGDDYEKWDVPALEAEYLDYKLANRIPYETLVFSDAKASILSLIEKGYLLGLASSTAKIEILRALEVTQLMPYFDVILSGESFKESKPNPEIYEVAMKTLSVLPEETLIIEDSQKGIAAGVASGATVWGIKDYRFGLDQNSANRLFDTLTQIDAQL
ncbi:HAD family hydrolase [Lactococcus paracarnosus]|uniref:HAD family phosphatase n=1 Tax=Pseudolactococcus paracarnosus TaxID=2749962 RepID=A0ABT0AP15_9LACT|nr:HAD family phosphatase [Lactococcus paracarnosus]MCJ1978302.1 HAD family phosphatase [Lactococcus paracarnosus]MCJ1984445.1 HAD family phosphatase [Lactococcus paracarnosus]MCJ1998875.1 HAD family phosphatase [Lactococcus paracarnosus]